MLDAYLEHQSLQELEALMPDGSAQVKQKLSQSLKEGPLNARGLFLLAQCHVIDEEPGDAKRLLEEVLEQDPGHVPAKTELAMFHFRDDERREAIRLLVEVTSARPEITATWGMLGEFLKQDGQAEASEDSSKQLGMITAFNTKLQAAQDAFRKAEFQTADSLCRQLLQLVPNEVRTLSLLARIARQFGHHEFSLSTLARCIETRPNDAAIGLEYAYSLLGSRKYQEALVQCERLIELAPELIQIYDLKAEVLYHLGEYEDAIEIYRELAEVPERRAVSLLHMGKALKTVGNADEAVASYQRAIEIEPGLGQAYWELADLKTYRFSDEEVGAMHDLLDAGEIPDLDKVLIQFALGKALEDAEEFAESFEHYQAANDAYSRIRPFRYTNRNNAFMSAFTADHFASGAARGDATDAPIFVVGLPRSGSTLVEQILSSHSHVDGTQELDEIVSIARAVNDPTQAEDGQYPHCVTRLDDEQINGLAQRYLDYARPFRQGASYFVDKAPHNFHHIGLIKTLFPNAKIVDIRRNPMASGWSLYRQFFSDSFQFSYNQESIGRYYNDYIALMDHWHKVLPRQILTIAYEDLVDDFSATVEAVLKHCGLEFEDACLDFHLNKRAVATPSSEQVRQPLYSSAKQHWKNYEAYLEPLRQAIENEEASQ